MLRVNSFSITVFVYLDLHALLSLLHSSFSSHLFIHRFHYVHTPWESVLFTYIVSCIQRYCHIRSPPLALHTSTLSLPLIIISSVPFYCHFHSHWTCPCGACTGMVKAHTGTGLLILCLYRPCMGMVRVSLPSRIWFFFFRLNGKPLLLSWLDIEHFVVCVYFQIHRYQTASEFGEPIALFSKDTIFVWSKQQEVTLSK